MSDRSLVDPSRYLGAVSFVSATTIQVNMPYARARPERRALARGVVGDFVFVDCELVKLLGRIIEVGISENERLSIEPSLGKSTDTHPVGRVMMFASVDHRGKKLVRGLRAHPRIGDSVYIADSKHFGDLICGALDSDGSLMVELGLIDAGGAVPLRLQPENLFGRHCGIFGATGGGKSWTLATVISQIKEVGGKAIVFDPTGEFAALPTISKHYAFDQSEEGATQVHFPYRQMTEDDLFAIFRPSGQTQGPKLREAVRSLKLVRAIGGISQTVRIYDGRILVKLSMPRAPVYAEQNHQRAALHNPYCDFDIENLADQLSAECVYSSDRANPASWGLVDAQAVSYCESLIARIRTLIQSNELSCLFGTTGPSLSDVLNRFVLSDEDDIIRISFKNVRFEHGTREILMNVIGRFLLGLARSDAFRARPMIAILDEAHQFLGGVIGDEYMSARLDSFGLIAKEGRKYGLTCVLATQRPRDVPPDVLSQLGTLVVHRLTNDDDRHAVERACGDLDRNAAMFIPTLSPGEAIIIGPDLPAPVPITVTEPSVPPNSKGPDYQRFWRSRKSD